MDMTLYIIIAYLFMLSGWLLTFYDNGDRKLPYGFIGGMIGVLLPAIIIACVVSLQPKAMDVYRGKTTLEITYKDSVAIDSVVVFKDKEK